MKIRPTSPTDVVDRLVWTIARGDQNARVCETGEVDGDADLVADLTAKLREPVTVFGHGTVRHREAAPRHEIVLQPGDGRYVAARMRALCADTADYVITGCEWR